MEKNYTFPFSTCETPCEDSIAAQPYSTIINAISTFILVCFLLKVKTYKVKLIILGLVAFEAVHTLSHYMHLKGDIQQNIIHFIVYFIIITTIIAFNSYNKIPNYLLLFILIIGICDLYIYFKIKGVYMIISGSLLFLVTFIILFQRLELPQNIINLVIYLSITIIVVMGLIINEAINCKKMMKKYEFPYHIFIEILGIVLFTLLAYIYYKIEEYYLS